MELIRNRIIHNNFVLLFPLKFLVLKLLFRNRKNHWQQLGDEALIAAYRQSGDMELLEELFNRYGHLVLGVCLKYLRNANDAHDACMQVFEKLIPELRKTEVGQFKPWIHTVTRNHCLLHIRKTISVERHRENYQKNFSEDFVNFWSEMNHIHEAEQEMKRLYSAMEKLDNDQRMCLEMIYFQDKSYREISELTGFDTGRVKSYIQNGKRNLKLLMEKDHGKE